MSDARQLYLPALNIVALVVFAVVATTQVSEFKHTMEAKITRVEEAFSRLNDQVADATVSRVSGTALRLWCADTERLNPKWRCAPLNEAFR